MQLRYAQENELAPADTSERGASSMGCVLPHPPHTAWFGQWGNGGKGLKNRYLGIKFTINGKFHYGWARISVSVTGHQATSVLSGYAYETIPNKAIIAGETKGPDVVTVQPGSLGHLATGASAVSAWRLKQTATTR